MAEEILKLARERFQLLHTAEQDVRNAALEDMKFAYNVDNGQWPADIRAKRQADSRPCLTSNKLRKFIAVIANKERENRIVAKVRPVDDKSDPATAKALQDIIRNIEYLSTADEIYTKAGEHALACGFGYWRILTDYASETSFDQEIKIAPIENPFSVYMDPQEEFCFVRDVMTLEEFKRDYPKATPANFSGGKIEEEMKLWYDAKSVHIAEYFQKEYRTKTIAEVKDNGVIRIIELSKDRTEEDLTAEAIKVLRTRQVRSYKIMWYKITGNEILEKEEWPGKHIPIVEVEGDKINVGGKTYKRSLIRDAKDPQSMYNFWLTAMTEKVALAPKAPFLVTPGEIKGYEEEWKRANTDNLPYLRFNPMGQRTPQRQQPAQVDAGAMSMLQIADGDIMDVIGMSEASLGEKSNERTGRAIFARQQRSDLGAFLFPDNLRRAIVKTGRILIDLTPKIYDTHRIERIIGEDGQPDTTVEVNKPAVGKDGESILENDLSVGKYDVQADIRQYSSRRQETVEMLIQAMQYAPSVAPFFVDLIFKYLDAPGADEIAGRLKEALAATQKEQQPAGTSETPPGTEPDATIGTGGDGRRFLGE